MEDKPIEHDQLNNQKDNLVFIMFRIITNLGYDMNGMYFIQLTNNEEQIEKFRKINQRNEHSQIFFYPHKYSLKQIKMLKAMPDLWEYHGCNDNIERLIKKGKLNVPGENKIYSHEELVEWWEKYLGNPKYPMWENIIEEIINLN